LRQKETRTWLLWALEAGRVTQVCLQCHRSIHQSQEQRHLDHRNRSRSLKERYQASRSPEQHNPGISMPHRRRAQEGEVPMRRNQRVSEVPCLCRQLYCYIPQDEEHSYENRWGQSQVFEGYYSLGRIAEQCNSCFWLRCIWPPSCQCWRSSW
jgi:hypothetical protein